MSPDTAPPPNVVTDRSLRTFRLGQTKRVVAVAGFRGFAQLLFGRLIRLRSSDHGGLLLIRGIAADDALMFGWVGRPLFRHRSREDGRRREPGKREPR